MLAFRGMQPKKQDRTQGSLDSTRDPSKLPKAFSLQLRWGQGNTIFDRNYEQTHSTWLCTNKGQIGFMRINNRCGWLAFRETHIVPNRILNEATNHKITMMLQTDFRKQSERIRSLSVHHLLFTSPLLIYTLAKPGRTVGQSGSHSQSDTFGVVLWLEVRSLKKLTKSI
jgi:hypothetical protein